MTEEKIGICVSVIDELYLVNLRECVIETVHKKVPEVRVFVEENFDLKSRIIRNLIFLAYWKSGLMQKDLLTEGVPRNPLDVAAVLENYGYEFIAGKNISLEAFSEYADGFRYKNDGETFYQFVNLMGEKSSKIRDALADKEPYDYCR